MGAKFEATIKQHGRTTPPGEGSAWESFEHRAADALHGMCDAVAVAERVETPMAVTPPLLVVGVAVHGASGGGGDPVARRDGRAAAGERGGWNRSWSTTTAVPVAVGKQSAVLSPKVVRAVRLRDGHCRIPGCEIRYGLHTHHLRPKSRGTAPTTRRTWRWCAPLRDTTRCWCPNGPWALVGNPNRPDGLELAHVDHLDPEQATSSDSHHPAPDRRRHEGGAVEGGGESSTGGRDRRRRLIPTSERGATTMGWCMPRR